MNTLVFALQTLSGCVVGFVVGFLVGRTAHDVHRIASAVTVEEAPMPVHRRTRWWSRVNGQLVVAVVVVALGVLTVVQGLMQSAATRRITECHSAYANAFADVIDARSQGSQHAQEALDKMMTTMAGLGATPPVDQADLERRREESRKALTEYVRERAELKALQKAHPYPAPPRDACPTPN